MSTPIVALVGASGFVGSAVKAELVKAGATVREVRAPRLACAAASLEELRDAVDDAVSSHTELVGLLCGADAVVNAAGDPDASSADRGRLIGANALLPGLLLEAARRARVPRLVHISSAVVQGNSPLLDESDMMHAFSPYSESKILGERVLTKFGEKAADGVVIYRPPSVHAASRRVTRRIAKIAASPLATVAAPGTQPSPQALIGNVASAVAFLALCPATPPVRVIHPWEGMTSAGLMRTLGDGRAPRVIPRALARALVSVANTLALLVPRLRADVRRVELLWFGQRQGRSWLSTQGWTPPLGQSAWENLHESADEL